MTKFAKRTPILKKWAIIFVRRFLPAFAQTQTEIKQSKTPKLMNPQKGLFLFLVFIALSHVYVVNAIVIPTFPVFSPGTYSSTSMSISHMITRTSDISNDTFIMYSSSTGVYFAVTSGSLASRGAGFRINTSSNWNFDFAIRSDGLATILLEENSPGDGIFIFQCHNTPCTNFTSSYIPQPSDVDIFNPPNSHPSTWGIQLTVNDHPVLSIIYYDSGVQYAPYIISCKDPACITYTPFQRFPQMSSSQANTGAYIGFDMILHPNTQRPFFVYWVYGSGPTVFHCNDFECTSYTSQLITPFDTTSQGYSIAVHQSKVVIFTMSDSPYFNQTLCSSDDCSNRTTYTVPSTSPTRSISILESSGTYIYLLSTQLGNSMSLALYSSSEYPLFGSVEKSSVIEVPTPSGQWPVFTPIQNNNANEIIMWADTNDLVYVSSYSFNGPLSFCPDTYTVASQNSPICISTVLETQVYSPFFVANVNPPDSSVFHSGATTLSNGYTYLGIISSFGSSKISVFYQDPLLENPLTENEFLVSTFDTNILSIEFSLQGTIPVMLALGSKNTLFLVNCVDYLCSNPTILGTSTTNTRIPLPDAHMSLNAAMEVYQFYPSHFYPQKLVFSRIGWDAVNLRYSQLDTSTFTFVAGTNNGHVFSSFAQSSSTNILTGLVLRQNTATPFDNVYPSIYQCQTLGSNVCSSISLLWTDPGYVSNDPRYPWFIIRSDNNVPIFGFSLKSSPRSTVVGYCETSLCGTPTFVTIDNLYLTNTRGYFDVSTSTLQIVGVRTLFGSYVPHLIYCYDVRCSSYYSTDLDITLGDSLAFPESFTNTQLSDARSFIFADSKSQVSVMTGFSSFCPVGYFASVPSCSPCVGASYKLNSLTTFQCDPCPLNSIVSANQTCQSCPSGSQPGLTGRECDLCAAGYSTSAYLPTDVSGSCNLCPIGKVSVDPGSSECTTCSPGTISSIDKSQCNTCPPQTMISNDTCAPCPECTLSGIETVPDSFSNPTPVAKSDMFFIDIQENNSSIAQNAQFITVIVWGAVILLFLIYRMIKNHNQSKLAAISTPAPESTADDFGVLPPPPPTKSPENTQQSLLMSIDRFGFPSAVRPDEKHPQTPYMTSKFGGMMTLIFGFTVVIGVVVLLFGFLYDNAVTVESRQMGADGVFSSFDITIEALMPSPLPLSDWSFNIIGLSGNTTSSLSVGQTSNTLLASLSCKKCSLSRSQSLITLSSSIPTRFVNSYSMSISLSPLDSGFSALPALSASLSSISPVNSSYVFNGPSSTIISSTVDAIQIQFLNLSQIEGYHFSTEPRLDSSGDQVSILDPLTTGVSFTFELYRSDSYLLVQNVPKRSLVEFISQIGGIVSGAAFVARAIMSRYWMRTFRLNHIREYFGGGSNSKTVPVVVAAAAAGAASTHGTTDVNLPVLSGDGYWT